ncbi:MAG: endonuclease Q family protein [Phycisphaerales bacterium]|nr:endonuclease Q family protein [Phycisphaerales bacterium]
MNRDRSAAPSGYIIDIVSSVEADVSGFESEDATNERPWVGVHFECCGVYTRVYRDAEARQYDGRCPRCGRPIKIGVGPQGIQAKVLRARLI